MRLQLVEDIYIPENGETKLSEVEYTEGDVLAQVGNLIQRIVK